MSLGPAGAYFAHKYMVYRPTSPEEKAEKKKQKKPWRDSFREARTDRQAANFEKRMKKLGNKRFLASAYAYPVPVRHKPVPQMVYDPQYAARKRAIAQRDRAIEQRAYTAGMNYAAMSYAEAQRRAFYSQQMGQEPKKSGMKKLSDILFKSA